MTMMRRQLSYSTKYIDNQLERNRMLRERAKQDFPNDPNPDETILLQRLDQCIADGQYDWIINKLCNLFHCYASNGDFCLQLENDREAARNNYYYAAATAVLCYEMVEKGFSHHVMDSGSPYDFKKNNINFSKAAILANEYELALKITGGDTVEGALVLQNYALARTILPEDPEDTSIAGDEIRQCMWAVAHGDEKLFNQYLLKRIKVLRHYGKLNAVTFDSWGLAVIKLALRRGIACDMKVIELPYHLLDDRRINASGWIFPRAEQIDFILNCSAI